MSEKDNKQEKLPAEPQPTPEVPTEGDGLNEKRKRALVSYLAILFGAAFLIVVISLAVTWSTSRNKIAELNNSTSSAMSRIEGLQAENKELLNENAQLKELNEQLQDNLEYAEAQAQEYVESIQMESQLRSSRISTAYELLLRAQEAVEEDNRTVYQTAMASLETLWQNLNETGQRVYWDLMAYQWDIPEE